ncbi:hypothetical protein [Marmoricola sp. RAF53]|uniref:hypothetical protein n=1 Tax=Marmoricola sp. RAF53 TaxID=3233059 RepID=UPI003F95ECF9
MNIPQPTELAEQVTDQIGQIADKIDTQDLKDRASTGASDLIDAATTSDGRPKKGLLIGVAIVAILIFVARRAMR